MRDTIFLYTYPSLPLFSGHCPDSTGIPGDSDVRETGLATKERKLLIRQEDIRGHLGSPWVQRPESTTRPHDSNWGELKSWRHPPRLAGSALRRRTIIVLSSVTSQCGGIKVSRRGLRNCSGSSRDQQYWQRKLRLPQHQIDTQHPRACGPGPRQWSSISSLSHPASWSASARIGRRSKARSS